MSRIGSDGSRKFLGRILRERREAAGLRQDELATKLGVPQSFVSKCETGERRVDVVELTAIARALGVPPAALLAEYERAANES